MTQLHSFMGKKKSQIGRLGNFTQVLLNHLNLLLLVHVNFLWTVLLFFNFYTYININTSICKVNEQR